MAASPDPRFALGIDFGTSHTTAILRWPDGHARPLLFDGSPQLPSGVYAYPDGRLLTGRDAIHAARLEPARYEPTPKRRIDHTSILLGEIDISLPDLVAAVLQRVRDEAVRVSGAWPDELAITLTHPANWSVSRRLVLTEATELAGLPDPRLMPEPVAAAAYFVDVAGRSLPPDSALLVYDFGGGTFDASLVKPTDGGYTVLAVDGLDDLGGADLDAALLEHIIHTQRDADPDAWDRLEKPETAADRRHRRHLVDDVRTVKEMLSRADSATVGVPLLEAEVTVTREDFEVLVRPLLERTIRTTSAVIRWTRLPSDQIAAVLLVGGSSRVPLVARLLRNALGVSPTTVEQPELIVAEGSVHSGQTGSWVAPTPPAGSAPVTPPVPTASAPPTVVSARVPVPSPRPRPAGPGELAPPADPWASAEDLTGTTFAPPPGTALVPLAPPRSPRAYGRATVRPYPPADDDVRPDQATPPSQRTPYEHMAYENPTSGASSTDRIGIPVAGPRRSPSTELAVRSTDLATTQAAVPSSPAAPASPERGRAKPPGPYLGTVVNTRSRLRWVRFGLATIGTLAVGAAAVLFGPRVLAGGAATGANAGQGSAGTSLSGETSGQPMSPRTHAPYLRVATPMWLPTGWLKLVDDAADGGAVVPGDAAPAGRCTYQGPGVFRVARDGADVAACRMRDQTKVRSAAAEAQFALTRGCGALWMRTTTDRRTTVGYLAMVCADGAVEVHELAGRPPGPATRKARWTTNLDPANVVVGVLAQGPRLTVYADGVSLGSVEDNSLATGRLGVGGYPSAGGLDVTVTDFRAWRAT